MQPARFFTKEDQELILQAIREAEESTSGEIRVHLEKKCPGEVLDRASYVFEKLGMHKTAKRNGVLFYLATDDRKFAILGDAGINALTPEDFWDQIKESLLAEFHQGKFAEGLSIGIRMAGQALKEFFPYEKGDINELPNEISSGNL